MDDQIKYVCCLELRLFNSTLNTTQCQQEYTMNL
jgi:hypothetical protein